MEPTDNPPPQQIPTKRGSGGSFFVLIAAAAAVIVIGVVACGGVMLLFGTVKSTAAAGITLSSGRNIRIVTDEGGVGASSKDDTGTFDIGSSQVVVKPDSVTLNGVQVAELDPAAMEVEVTYMSGKVSVAVDSAVVGTAEETTIEPNGNSP